LAVIAIAFLVFFHNMVIGHSQALACLESSARRAVNSSLGLKIAAGVLGTRGKRSAGRRPDSLNYIGVKSGGERFIGV
jgi:hypothetical protein